MKDFLTILISTLRVFLILMTPGGHKKIVSENLALKQQLIVVSRKQSRSPKLKAFDRIVFAFLAFFIPAKRLSKIGVIVKPATILKFHRALVKKKYRLLFGSNCRKKLGRKGFDKDMIKLVLDIKIKNPGYGCPKIAMLVSNITDKSISEQTVRRILRRHFKPDPGDGPSWLSFIGNQVDSLWSVDFFRAESILLKSYWIMIVMDIHSRKIIGFSIQKTACTGPSVCRMFNEILGRSGIQPKRISTDNDPLFQSHRWKANLRIAGIEEIKSVPGVPTSHPFVERVIGTTRRECLDQILFWNEVDLGRKLSEFRHYYNEARVHYSLNGIPPDQFTGNKPQIRISPKNYGWKKYCRRLYSVPIAA